MKRNESDLELSHQFPPLEYQGRRSPETVSQPSGGTRLSWWEMRRERIAMFDVCQGPLVTSDSHFHRLTGWLQVEILRAWEHNNHIATLFISNRRGSHPPPQFWIAAKMVAGPGCRWRSANHRQGLYFRFQLAVGLTLGGVRWQVFVFCLVGCSSVGNIPAVDQLWRHCHMWTLQWLTRSMQQVKKLKSMSTDQNYNWLWEYSDHLTHLPQYSPFMLYLIRIQQSSK